MELLLQLAIESIIAANNYCHTDYLYLMLTGQPKSLRKINRSSRSSFVDAAADGLCVGRRSFVVPVSS